MKSYSLRKWVEEEKLNQKIIKLADEKMNFLSTVIKG